MHAFRAWQVRVDFFLLAATHAFSELTFTPFGCRAGPLVPASVDSYLSSLGGRGRCPEDSGMRQHPQHEPRRPLTAAHLQRQVAEDLLGLIAHHEEEFVWTCSSDRRPGGEHRGKKCGWLSRERNGTERAPSGAPAAAAAKILLAANCSEEDSLSSQSQPGVHRP